jgi:hypothetical protein
MVIFSTQPSRRSTLPLLWLCGITIAYSEMRCKRCVAVRPLLAEIIRAETVTPSSIPLQSATILRCAFDNRASISAKG